MRDPDHVDPEQYRADQAVLDLPGRAAYQRDLLWDYRNPQQYPHWQQWLRRRRPDVLAVWGGRDPWFVPAGAHAFRRDVPDAEVVFVDSGHFALEEELDPIATLIEKFLERTLP